MSNTPREDVIKLAREAGFAVGIGSPVLPKLMHLIQLVKEEEREACAKVCESRYMGDNNREDMEARQCAAAIRARSNGVICRSCLVDRLKDPCPRPSNCGWGVAAQDQKEGHG